MYLFVAEMGWLLFYLPKIEDNKSKTPNSIAIITLISIIFSRKRSIKFFLFFIVAHLN